MPIHNADVAGIFGEIADLLEIEGAIPFRVRAYRNAARILGDLGTDVRGMLEQGADLTELPGIGDDLAGKIREIVDTGHCAMLDKLHRRIPHPVVELLKLPGLGPKRVKALYQDLDIHTVAQLQRAARDGRLRELPDDALARLDLVVGAVHSKFNLPRSKQTARILKAMDHPHC